ncbi:unnamed protein product [Bursaphelenchus okinawaensis]|uniref:Inner centromere protein ARK-binding domain-containing protein n=1 Tax=Bursaphelenchus okinawaensis TaxID=465554 RepID=A0A811LB31_9BILA|nr:unnamed protein product [Bursaphelenchus okinawaensis]CAG9120135.1 unnamed protein product [Bursaphelenchus okinawaensis]
MARTRGGAAKQTEDTLDSAILRALEAFGIDYNAVKERIETQVQEEYAEACDEVLQVRMELKKKLEACFEGHAIPSTPKKNYRPPAAFLAHRKPQLLDFDGEENATTSTENEARVSEDLDIVVASKNEHKTKVTETEMVIDDNVQHIHTEVHVREVQEVIEASPVARTPKRPPQPTPRTLKTPIHLVDVIPASPSPCITRPVTRAAVAPKPKSTKAITEELQRKNELAAQRKAEIQKEKAERKKYQNEERKRRVEENKRKKQLEEAQKKEEHRKKHEAIKRYQEEQRMATPGTPRTPGHTTTLPRTPGQTVNAPRTPGQKAVPPKRPRPKPVTIEETSESQSVHATEHVNIAQPVQAAAPEVKASPAVVREAEEQTQRLVIEETYTSFLDKENEVMDITVTPQTKRLNHSAYEMTPEKVPLPSTENDYNVADLSSNDETDNEDEPRKKVPNWAQKDQLRIHIASLKQRKTFEQINAHFGVVKPPRVSDIFQGPSKKTYKKLDETTLWESPIQNPRAAPLQNIRSLN